ncbi:MAG: FAD-dependent oxidoreductase, partial [Saprospiraceae bacterium]|nr:FAD-dependent oxidoreductase [Saprospiraceae bacterium]
PQVYIRESRRMIGEYIMTQKDIEKETTKKHSIGLGSYSLDSHHVQRLINEDGELINEGNFTIQVAGPYEIPFEAILPKRNECSNLLVPVCLSSSHVAFGSIRMEPVFMVLGQSAATAAALALSEKVDLHDLNYDLLEEHLLKAGQLFKVK